MGHESDIDRLHSLERQLDGVMEQIRTEMSDALEGIEEQKQRLASAHDELKSREHNVVRLEKSVRDHLQEKNEQSEAGSKRSKTAVCWLHIWLLPP